MLKLILLLSTFTLWAYPKYEYEGLLNAYYSKKSDIYFASKFADHRDVIAFQPFIGLNFSGGFLWDYGYSVKGFKYSSRIVNLNQTTVVKEFPSTINVPVQLNLFIPNDGGLILLGLPQEVTDQYIAPNLEVNCRAKNEQQFVNVSSLAPYQGVIDQVLINEEVGINGLGAAGRSLSFVGKQNNTVIKQGYFNIQNLPKNSICKAYVTYFRIFREFFLCKTRSKQIFLYFHRIDESLIPQKLKF